MVCQKAQLSETFGSYWRISDNRELASDKKRIVNCTFRKEYGRWITKWGIEKRRLPVILLLLKSNRFAFILWSPKGSECSYLQHPVRVRSWEKPLNRLVRVRWTFSSATLWQCFMLEQARGQCCRIGLTWVLKSWFALLQLQRSV